MGLGTDSPCRSNASGPMTLSFRSVLASAPVTDARLPSERAIASSSASVAAAA